MKKLKLKALELGAKEVLTREQLKKLVGGGNPNCVGVPAADWYCGKNGTCTHLGNWSCDDASSLCVGGLITTSSTCTPLVIVPPPKPD